MDVLLVDQSPVWRERIALMLRDLPDVRVVAEASTASEARQAAVAHPTDAVVLDLALAGSGGLRLLREIRALRPCALVIVVTNDPSTTYCARCLEAADLCLDKTQDMGALLDALAQGVARGPGTVRKGGAPERTDWVVTPSTTGLGQSKQASK